MKQDDEHKKPSSQEGLGKKQNLTDKKELKQLLLKLVEEKNEQSRFSDKHFDREQQKHKLLNGSEISISDVKNYIRSKARTYAPMFSIAFWRQLYRICGWAQEEAEVYFKRREAAMFVREVIYGRFDKGVLLSFHVLNPYTGYIKREYKHFQFLTDAGIEKLAVVIKEAKDMMKDCSSYMEFRKKWYEEYGVPYQTNAFE